MEFVINKETLKEELGFMQGIIEKRTTIPALSSVLFQSDGENRIRITGSNLETTMHTYVSAKVLKEGAILINAKRISDMVRLLDFPEIRFQAEENSWVQVESGNAKFRIAALSADEYPKVPVSTNTNLELTSDLILSFIQMTGFAISLEQSRYLLSAAKLLLIGKDGGERKLRMVTTDGHRMALVEKSLQGETYRSEADGFDILIPRRTLQELGRICRSVDKVSLGEDENHLYFVCGNRSLIARKLVGNFPNYEIVIPKETSFAAEFDPEILHSALRRVSLMADEMNHAVKITLGNKETLIEAFSQDGEAKEIIPADYEGKNFVIGFNSRYIQEFLDVVLSMSESFSETEEVEKEVESDKVKVKANEVKKRVKFEFIDSHSQVLIRPIGWKDYNYIYVLMPLRL